MKDYFFGEVDPSVVYDLFVVLMMISDTLLLDPDSLSSEVLRRYISETSRFLESKKSISLSFN